MENSADIDSKQEAEKSKDEEESEEEYLCSMEDGAKDGYEWDDV